MAIPGLQQPISKSSISRPVVTLELPEPFSAPIQARPVAEPTWQSVPQRRGDAPERSAKLVPLPMDDPTTRSPSTSVVRPKVPTAATVWFARGSTGAFVGSGRR